MRHIFQPQNGFAQKKGLASAEPFFVSGPEV
jgi:hypothetical protein